MNGTPSGPTMRSIATKLTQLFYTYRLGILKSQEGSVGPKDI